MTSEESTTLLLASFRIPSARQLAAAHGGRAHALDEDPRPAVAGPRTFYGGTDKAAEYADRFELCLIEPSLDLITRVPGDLLGRNVGYCRLADLARLTVPHFVKPADPLDKSFDAGVY